MRLRGVFAKLLDFTDKDRSAPGHLISRPYFGDTPPDDYADCREVPYFHQRHINCCSDACKNMLLAYKGKPYQSFFDKNPRKVFEGLSTSELKRQLMAEGLDIAPIVRPPTRHWPPEALADHLKRYGPILCAGRIKGDVVDHFIILFGVSYDKVVFHDPWSGPNKVWSLEEFNAFLDWEDKDFMLAVTDKPVAAAPASRCDENFASPRHSLTHLQMTHPHLRTTLPSLLAKATPILHDAVLKPRSPDIH